FPVQYVPNDVSGGDVCFNNNGGGTVQLMGYAGAVRFEFVRPGRESWASLAPAIVGRFGLVKAGWEGSWSVWLVGFLVVLAAAIEAALARRHRRRDRGHLSAAALLRAAGGHLQGHLAREHLRPSRGHARALVRVRGPHRDVHVPLRARAAAARAVDLARGRA